MARSKSFRRVVSSGFVGLAISILLCGADDAKQKVDAKGLTFEAPASWKLSPPSSPMRRAELKVQPIDGDAFPGELVVYAFPGGVGSVQGPGMSWTVEGVVALAVLEAARRNGELDAWRRGRRCRYARGHSQRGGGRPGEPADPTDCRESRAGR